SAEAKTHHKRSCGTEKRATDGDANCRTCNAYHSRNGDPTSTLPRRQLRVEDEVRNSLRESSGRSARRDRFDGSVLQERTNEHLTRVPNTIDLNLLSDSEAWRKDLTCLKSDLRRPEDRLYGRGCGGNSFGNLAEASIKGVMDELLRCP